MVEMDRMDFPEDKVLLVNLEVMVFRVQGVHLVNTVWMESQEEQGHQAKKESQGQEEYQEKMVTQVLTEQ